MKRIHLYIFLVLSLSLLWLATPGRSQAPLSIGSPSIGQVSPNFTLPIYIEGRGEPKIRHNSDYLGKWLVLKFWSKYCISCIEGFPVFEKLRSIFSDNAEFLLIGKNDQRYNSGIQKFYNTFRDDWQLKLDVAFDSLTFKNFEINTTPTTVIITPEGKIASIIIGEKLSEEKLRNLFSGNKYPSVSNVRALKPTSFKTRKVVDSTSLQPHISVLTDFKANDATALRLDVAKGLRDGVFATSPINLARLYMLANFGKANWGSSDPFVNTIWPKPILEIKDTSLFNFKIGTDTGLYNYKIILKSNQISLDMIKSAISSDLWQWFGYSTVIETRDMPVMKLVQNKNDAYRNLRAKGNEINIKGDASGYRMRNMKIERLLAILRTYHYSKIIIDKTNIKFPIDLDLDVNMLEISSIKKALNLIGLDLIETTTPMQVLVISDN